ncbi:class I SAM-dependent methyltransferase [uncultured Shewanella sp.]|uniref:class I SAM-dependent methyltransferase n=1 Tax=Shewanella atlantica TaxID=271099 RepID=UPI0026196458|nr:class I SAM-dependent methyltransferase [uncultured Shewanella sp.]
MNACPLCGRASLLSFYQDRCRSYLRCDNCHLVLVPPEFLLSVEAEKAVYDQHQNDPADENYRRFLSRVFDPLISQLPKGARGLDYGCGPGPTISVMARESGLSVSNYDLYYQNTPEVLEHSYDFITITEVIEHVADAKGLLVLLNDLLRPGGILAVMTSRVGDEDTFGQWHYKNDPTHIRFYSIETFEWIARYFDWQLEVVDKDVVFFYKK